MGSRGRAGGRSRNCQRSVQAIVGKSPFNKLPPSEGLLLPPVSEKD